MFWQYKAIIRHHIIEEFYPTPHFLQIFFSRGLLLSFYILSTCHTLQGKWPRYKIK
jgi:hypothetical protein